MSKSLLAQLRKSREKTVDLGGGLEVTFRRPPENDIPTLLTRSEEDPTKRVWTVDIEHVLKYVNGWKGFSEATFLGASVGSSDPIAFDPELWAETCTDNMAWTRKIADEILNSVVEHFSKQDAAAKNSEPASTSPPGQESKAAESSSPTPTP